MKQWNNLKNQIDKNEQLLDEQNNGFVVGSLFN